MCCLRRPLVANLTQRFTSQMGGRWMSAAMAADEIEQVTPRHAWDILSENPDAMLIDVRTRAEWGFVGVPDLSTLGKSTVFVEWAKWPDMSQDPAFIAAATAEIGPEMPGTMLFLCRSGVRSLYAADAVARHLRALGSGGKCINVAEGFEGDKDEFSHRGRLNGWKFHGLPWVQS